MAVVTYLDYRRAEIRDLARARELKVIDRQGQIALPIVTHAELGLRGSRRGGLRRTRGPGRRCSMACGGSRRSGNA